MEGTASNTDSARNDTGATVNANANGNDSRGERGGRSRGGDRNRGRGSGRGRGSDRGRGGGRGKGFASKNGSERQRTGDMGRGEYNRMNVDKRKQIDETRERREKTGDGAGSNAGVQFTKEEIEGEARKPKKKVAVMIGYAGSGYKGMQINALEKTIEGDLFKAFVHAGAIAKANADDPKKSSLVRCARTDKGVHAAGNVISLKLIMEDPHIVEKINEHLPPQIRVWGMERTNGSFSCYQSCDSRWYEYLIPTFSFIPPHPQSYLGKKLVESAKFEDTLDTYEDLQKDVASFWETVEKEYVQPILDRLDPELRASVVAAIHSMEEEPKPKEEKAGASEKAVGGEESLSSENKPDELSVESMPSAEADSLNEVASQLPVKRKAEDELEEPPATKRQQVEDTAVSEDSKTDIVAEDSVKVGEAKKSTERAPLTPLEAAIKEVKAAYITAKKAYRISDVRRARVQAALSAYLGTRNFHNYTIMKKFSDPSAKRVIRSFNVGKDPVIINDTEWLSLKVHGQSFMMHQIRKMVAMAALVVRCGSPISIIHDSYGSAPISIPKAPGLGLLLERPVFETYNARAKKEYEREKIDFDKFQKEMDEFKQREIYDRIFREEERDHQFHAFFHHIDHYRTDYFLWVTAGGLSAAKQSTARREDASDDEEPDVRGEEG